MLYKTEDDYNHYTRQSLRRQNFEHQGDDVWEDNHGNQLRRLTWDEYLEGGGIRMFKWIRHGKKRR